MCLLGSAPAAEPPLAGAVEVYRCRFEACEDRDFDGWPDGWTRHWGPGYPRYVHMQIADAAPPGGGRCLRVDLDGRGALAHSPAIPVRATCSYVLEGAVDAEGLTHDQACLSVTFLDAQRKEQRTFFSEPVRSTGGWRKVRLGPIAPDAGAALAVIGLHVQPAADAEDLHGVVKFGDLGLGRMPRVCLTAAGEPSSVSPLSPGEGPGAGASQSSPLPPGEGPGVRASALNLFSDPHAINVNCGLSGLDARGATVTFQLEDAFGQELAAHTRRLALAAVPAADAVPDDPERKPSGEFAGAASWKPPISAPGFYRVRASVVQDAGPAASAELTLAVIEPQRAPPGSEFGWSLPCGDRPLPLALLGELLCQSGAGWVKYPITPGDGKRPPPVDSLLALSDRLSEGRVRLVVMGTAPQAYASGPDGTAGDAAPARGPGPDAAPAAADRAAMELFSGDPKTWYPSLQLLQARLGPRLAWWQLGGDRDASWTLCPDLASRLAQVKLVLDRIGQDVRVGVAWDPRQPIPTTLRPCEFLTLALGEAMSAEQLTERLEAARQPRVARWVLLEALSDEGRSVEARAEDLVKRMIVAKAHGAEGIFCPDPFDPRHGLVREDGSPGELLLPWRTTALLLGGAKPLGRISLPAGSAAWIFQRPEGLVAAVWNERPGKETVYLGDDLRQVDPWGGSRPCPPAALESENGHPVCHSTIRTAPLPGFLAGLNEAVTRWQLDAALDPSRLPSIPTQPHSMSLCLKNSFAQAVSGEATLTAPTRWRIEPSTIEFHLAPGQSQKIPLEITLPMEVTAGRQAIALDFHLQADRQYPFRAWREIEVGTGDVTVEAAARLSDQGDLEVEQTLVNRGGQPVSFRCSLLVPDRRRQSSHIVRLQTGRDRQVYRLPDGQELLGKTLWLRAEEINGPRVLNCRLVPTGPASATAVAAEHHGIAVPEPL
jgi:hypothetical protein